MAGITPLVKPEGSSVEPSQSLDPVAARARGGRPKRGTSALRAGGSIGLDLATIALALIAARIGEQSADVRPAPLASAGAFALLLIVTLAVQGAYRERFTLHFLDDVRLIIGATAFTAMAMTFVRVLFTNEPDIASQAVRAWLFTAAYLTAGRGGYRIVQERARRLGEAGEPTLIIGAGQVGHLVARRLMEHPEFGLRPVAFLDEQPLQVDQGVDLPVVGALGGVASPGLPSQLETAVRELGIWNVIITFSLASHEQELDLMRRCRDLGVSVSLVPRLFEGVPDQTRLERVGGIPLIAVHLRDPRSWQFTIKYGIDRIVAVLGILLTAPLFLLAAVGTLVTLGRPLFFRQERAGMDGQEFEMLKFRTMRAAPGVVDAALEEDLENGLAPGGVEGEDRRTRFGTLLRRTSLDELPQLLNVLRGEMTLVGPRPERPEFAQRFRVQIHRYGDRLRVKSGITGWAQVHGLRGRTSLADRVEWDNYYIENWSPWLDVKIVLLTLRAVLGNPTE